MEISVIVDMAEQFPVLLSKINSLEKKVESLQNLTEPEMLNEKEVMELCNWTSLRYTREKMKEVGFSKIGNTYFVETKEFYNWVRRQKNLSLTQIKQEAIKRRYKNAKLK